MGLCDLIHPTSLLIPQSNLARRNRSGVAAAGGLFRPHPFTYNMDSVELFGETHSVGEVVAGGLFRAYSFNCLIHLTGKGSVELQGFSDLISPPIVSTSPSCLARGKGSVER